MNRPRYEDITASSPGPNYRTRPDARHLIGLLSFSGVGCTGSSGMTCGVQRSSEITFSVLGCAIVIRNRITCRSGRYKWAAATKRLSRQLAI